MLKRKMRVFKRGDPINDIDEVMRIFGIKDPEQKILEMKVVVEISKTA